MARYLYSELASLVQARRNCAQYNSHAFQTAEIKSHCATCGQTQEHWNHLQPRAEWFDKHEDRILQLVKDHMPYGSGFDSGTGIDLDASHGEKLVFTTSYHHMDDNGYYDGWTEHVVTVTPSFSGGYRIRISGRNRNEIKDYIHESFDYSLGTDVTYDLYLEQLPHLKITSAWENEDGTPSQCYMAWYCNGMRFWNDYLGAKTYAAAEMNYALTHPKQTA